MAELLAAEGFDVTLITPAPHVSQWTVNTLEVQRIRARIIRAGIAVHTNTALTRIAGDRVDTACVFTGDEGRIEADSVVLVTARLPENALYDALMAREADWESAGIRSVRAVGDAWAPSTIAAAVYAGHRYAEELDDPSPPPARREVAQLAKEAP